MARSASTSVLVVVVLVVFGLVPKPAQAAPTPTPTPSASPTATGTTNPTPTDTAVLQPTTLAPAPEPAPALATTSSTPTLSTGESAIAAKAAELQGALGPATSQVFCGLTQSGCGQHYQGGEIYWSPATGAHFVRGSIREVWTHNNWENGFLGYPTSDEFCGLAQSGCGQHYQGADVYWSPATGAHVVRDDILAKWAANGAQAGFLGYPTSDQFCGLAQNGCGQHYQGGEIYWSPASGAHFVRGSIRETWTHNNWENGFLGYPTSDEFCGLTQNGCGQHYQGGEIYWSPATGAHFVRGSIRETWTHNNWENGFLGYPTSDEFCGLTQNGCGQHYQGGEIYWSPATGAHFVRGSIRETWTHNNWENGFLGYPTSDEFCGLTQNGCGQHYQGGEIYWSPATDAHFVRGSIRETWTHNNWENGRLGYPTTDEICSSFANCRSAFQHGAISWTLTGGTSISWDLHPSVRVATDADVSSTYRAGCPVPPSSLRTIDLDYRDFNGAMQRGQIIIRDYLVNDVITAFSKAYGADYEFHQITNPNAFGGDDPTQMAADNTSGFNCRSVVGNPYAVSPHSYGTAVDMNTVENPYRDDNGVWWPSNGSAYILGAVLDRPVTHPAVLRTDSTVVSSLESKGWFWGGRWNPGRDYQHIQY
ncbi:M15 family metallopeptidase [Raineyella fluvialis]|uniref:Peptidase M15C domain-containing protein n=1 Tax=Raineyella fluvialis TaxID=2662261 RepID=A0A5Q2FFT1_9ACTN|nr:M15 family metallopeptidase [Raineyella fluvialis]QGF23535.1 hypothetical protein Rai3103_07510 [Raineyella fluvialis]